MPAYKIEMGEIVFGNCEELSVSDVYDLACEIGKECEGLIAKVGADPVNGLIKKVILSLELLEKFATRNEQEHAALTEMDERIQKLEAEKRMRSESRHKFEKEIETVEEQWRNESREMMKLVHRLQEDNKRLMAESGSGQASTADKVASATATVVELENMQKVFRHEVENHKNEIKRRDEEAKAQQEEIARLQQQMETLKATNVEAKRFQRELQGQIRTLVNERTNLICRIQDQHTEIVALKRVPNSGAATEPVPTDTVTESATTECKQEDPIADYDAPVQGPMPCEPDDAPWKRTNSESGIRKFFRQLFLETDTNSGPLASFSKLGMNSFGN